MTALLDLLSPSATQVKTHPKYDFKKLRFIKVSKTMSTKDFIPQRYKKVIIRSLHIYDMFMLTVVPYEKISYSLRSTRGELCR